MKNKKGISLITLVITIIVVIILAGVIIFSLTEKNPMDTANEAVFKQNISTYKEELDMYHLNQISKTSGSYDRTELNKTGNDIKEVIKSMKDTDTEKFKIEAGELVFIGENETEKTWAEAILTSEASEEKPYEVSVAPVDESTTGTVNAKNSTINGEESEYNNPLIPAGFYPVNTTDASWSNEDAWNNGLVIKDASGNEYVWVPVKTASDFKKTDWNKGRTLDQLSEDDYTGLTAFDTSVATYGGYYVARYEASKDGSMAASKKGKDVWNRVTYTDAKAAAESVATNYGYTTVASSLITGKAWDTMLAWIESAGYSVTDSALWGNHSNSTGGGSLKTTGSSETWKAKNIYDVAGNVREWTTEVYGTYRVRRGGRYNDSSSNNPAAYRSNGAPSYSNVLMGFRSVLYIL